MLSDAVMVKPAVSYILYSCESDAAVLVCEEPAVWTVPVLGEDPDEPDPELFAELEEG